MSDILHVTPVMPVDELHIEHALDSAEHAGSLVTSWVPSRFEHALLRAVPALWRKVRREPVRLQHRRVVRHLWPDVRHFMDLRAHLLESDLLAHDEFFHRVDRTASALVASSTRMVIGREFGCEQTFKQAQNLGVTRLYHLPTVDHDTLHDILKREQALFPDICSSTFDPFEFHPKHMLSKRNEIAMADKIMCPSQFVKQSLLDAGVDDTKISVTPFGSEQAWLEFPRRKTSGKTILFVGNISVRKGAHRLLQMWKHLGAFRTHKLLLVGDMHLTSSFLKDYAGMYEHRPRMPRENLRDIYLQADALVLPALAEGFALVIQEALSCGVPVLASRNSGAEGFLNDGTEARLFAAQDDIMLATTLEWALSHPTELEALGHAGRVKAREWTWRSFELVVQQQVASLLSMRDVKG
ncbi:glycosyltransferase [Prosthecobacter sp.]|uniref:glycosyltransferase n=1 Tax=Prosthecobacter sp. TaxID=1965333 RepID=UPI002AB8A11A|nr:glycosyltransferase [Prosthecobacter sp.]MDZ4401076.1 glycosyltransferase [Prosthecobacter sp.]